MNRQYHGYIIEGRFNKTTCVFSIHEQQSIPARHQRLSQASRVYSLSKTESRENHSVRYCSQTVSAKVQKLAKTHRDFLEVTWLIKLCCSYLKGARFTVKTDQVAVW